MTREEQPLFADSLSTQSSNSSRIVTSLKLVVNNKASKDSLIATYSDRNDAYLETKTFVISDRFDDKKPRYKMVQKRTTIYNKTQLFVIEFAGIK